MKIFMQMIFVFYIGLLTACSEIPNADSPISPSVSSKTTESESLVAPADFSNQKGSILATECRPASTVSCSCEGSQDQYAYAACKADGSGWHPCQCNSAKLNIFVDGAVAINGEGTLQSPFNSILAAKNHIRELNQSDSLPSGGTRVLIKNGRYSIDQTFAFEKEDSGKSGSPITYQAFPGHIVSMYGQGILRAKDFTKLSPHDVNYDLINENARDKIVSINLNAVGLNKLGTRQRRGFQIDGKSGAELYVGGQLQTLARWPNKNYDSNVQTGMTSIKSTDSDTKITLHSNRPATWNRPSEIWGHGYFAFDWADYHIPVKSIESDGTIALQNRPPGKPRVGKAAYFYNIIEELDEEGEYYIDATNKTLYYYPPAGWNRKLLALTTNEQALVRLSGAQFLTFANLTIAYSRDNLVEINDSSNIVFENMVLNASGKSAIVAEGQRLRFRNLKISDVGESGISMTGGNRANLTSAQTVLSHSAITRFSQKVRTYQPGVLINGNNIGVKNNKIHDAPHSAIIFWGSEHLMSGNEIFSVCHETNDAGAIYGGRDWGAYGNRIFSNLIYDIKSSYPASHDVHAIYLDDALSGITIRGNIIDDVGGYGIHHGGGHDVTIENNILSNTGVALKVDARARDWSNVPSQVTGNSWNLLEKLELIGYRSPLWQNKYPRASAIPGTWNEIFAAPERWLTPYGSRFYQNVGFNNRLWTKEVGDDVLQSYAHISRNDSGIDNPYVNARIRDYTIKVDHDLNRFRGWQRIPTEKIGLRHPWF